MGLIKELEIVDGQILAVVDFGNGDNKTCITYGGAGLLSYPQVGDQCVVENIGNEFVIVAIFTSDENLLTGEVILFGRDADGARVSTVHLDNSGNINLTNDECNIELSEGGRIKMSNEKGFLKIGAGGIINLNGKFTVDP